VAITKREFLGACTWLAAGRHWNARHAFAMDGPAAALEVGPDGWEGWLQLVDERGRELARTPLRAPLSASFSFSHLGNAVIIAPPGGRATRTGVVDSARILAPSGAVLLDALVVGDGPGAEVILPGNCVTEGRQVCVDAVRIECP